MADERVASLHFQMGEHSLTVIPTYMLNGSSEFPAYLESIAGVLEVLQWDSSLCFNAHVGNDCDLKGCDWEE